MNVMEIAKNYPNVKFEVSGADLMEFGLELIEFAKKEKSDSKENEGTMSQKEAAEYLGKSVTTIIRWGNSGYIKPCSYVGNSPRYSVADLRRLKEGSGTDVR